MNEKRECEHCGAMVSRKNMCRHKKTKVCIAAQQQVEQPVEESKEEVCEFIAEDRDDDAYWEAVDNHLKQKGNI